MPKIVEYIWIDGYFELRSKIRIIPDKDQYTLNNIPIWNFDGSSTKQSNTSNSEIYLIPCSLYPNPFHPNGYIVLCDVYMIDTNYKICPQQQNTRFKADKIFKQYLDYKPWFGIEQEYYILEPEDEIIPFQNKEPKEQGKYYCGVNIKGREIAEAHMYACLSAGLKISGINAEVGPSQWEYQIGPVEGIEACDQLWISRYLLQRIAEKYSSKISFKPKPLGEEWAGNGCHINFSTEKMREPDGLNYITQVIDKLKDNHNLYIKECGNDSEKRLTGNHETASYRSFNSGIGSRNTSIRIPKNVYINKKGYLEDRRPSGNMDPYVLCSMIMSLVG